MSQRLHWSAATLAAAVCLSLGACSQAQPEPPAASRTSPASTARPDPRPSAQRIDVEKIERELAPMLSRSSRDLAVASSPRGGARIDLADRFQHLAIARQKSDGTIERSCLTTPEELSALLRSASEAP
jgi:hypothetical protein